MFRTAQSPYNIVEATPFARDVVKELADECHRQGIRLHFYYSLIAGGARTLRAAARASARAAPRRRRTPTPISTS